MVSIHKKNAALRRGSLKKLLADRQLMSYGRFYSNDHCMVVMDSGAVGRTMKIPVQEIGICDDDWLTRVTMMYTEGYNVGAVDCPVEDGILTSKVCGDSGIMLVSNKDERGEPMEKNEQTGQNKQLE